MTVRPLLQRVRVNFRRNEVGITLLVLLALFVAVYFSSSIFIAIHAGERGVLWSRLHGTVTDRMYPEGLHAIAPWDAMTVYNVRFQTVDQTFQVLSGDGLGIGIELTARFRPSDKQLGHLHQKIGPDYVKSVVAPEVGNAARVVVARYQSDGLYEGGFAHLQDEIVDLAREEMRERFVMLDDVLVRSITLPVPVAEAIQRKLQQKQAAEEMEYRLAREQSELERKRIEAGGIKVFNDVAGASLTAGYLRLRSIEAALELARSSNAKVIVIGSGSSAGQPLIFDADMFGSTATPAPRATPR